MTIEQEDKARAYVMTEKLTYYVITAELVFCGYLLLNADKLVNFKEASYLFFSSGVAVLLGLLWRFCYNITSHARSHGSLDGCSYQVANFFQSLLHNCFVALSIIAMGWALISGSAYIKEYKSYEVASRVGC